MEPAAWVLTVQRLRISGGMVFVYSFRAGTFSSSSVSVIGIPSIPVFLYFAFL